MSDYRFKLGMYLPELQMPFEEALATARDIGVEYIWYNDRSYEKSFMEMSDAEVDAVAASVSEHGLQLFLLSPGGCFKQVHLADLKLEDMENHPEFRAEMDSLVRTMEVAAHLGVPAVNTFTFAWPGEYSAGKPTWPMRWLTRGGVIADVDMEKLVKAFSLMVEHAERHQVDIALGMMPWNYTNTTGNFRRVVEQVDADPVHAVAVGRDAPVVPSSDSAEIDAAPRRKIGNRLARLGEQLGESHHAVTARNRLGKSAGELEQIADHAR